LFVGREEVKGREGRGWEFAAEVAEERDMYD